MAETLTPNQRRTAAARAAFQDQFPSEEARRAYYRQLSAKGNTGRITLSARDAAELIAAYETLARLTVRARQANGGEA